MDNLTIEDASKCPKCGAVGVEKLVTQESRGRVTHTYNCQNKSCTWFETGWVVQVNKDGTIPQPDNTASNNRLYPKMNDRAKTIAQRQIDEVTQADQ